MKRRHDTRPVTTTPDEFVRCTEVFLRRLPTGYYDSGIEKCRCIKANNHNSQEHKAVIGGGVVRWRVKSERKK